MSVLELVAVALGLGNILLLVRRSVWNFPFGIAMVALYAMIFWQAQLYSDALLQLFFIVVNAWGWALWSRNREAVGDIIVRSMSPRLIAGSAVCGTAAIFIWGLLEARLTDAAYPWLDAGVAIASVIAQILLARRYIENWLVWIGVDIASILLYALKGLHPTMMLYTLFLALSAWGWIEWRRAERVQGRGAAA
ncbi:nicotinamide riboside transporter PnuC [Sphingomonas jatrophae]|uniref:Nicotinamide riboside transporter PnuC n=1 Tax=Sphingomonas jatrophae TaxID=1166337 RepID=A0A1I6K657_9SPHN|nr:nicotinamide riboside transporter PnuC [Sphingomonas jatrophae]SFR86320.1 nicotinamide mononucleotide transporter [Sphingomonas jatrophae]